MPHVLMRLVLIVARDIPLTAAGRSMADLASKLPTNVEATPTQTEVEVILPLAVQVNVRPRTEVDIMGEVPEEAEEITKEKAVDFFLGNKQRNSQTKGGLLQTTAFASTDRTLLARDYYLLDDTVLVKLEVNR
jgi:hypothetical protein